jgi:NAD(P)-dependent dehydrogenase (short-subunit alcohol dehydrogenase family)
MGLATARAFAEAGAAVVLADFKEDAAKAAALTSSDRTLVAAQFALALQGFVRACKPNRNWVPVIDSSISHS